MSVYGTSVVRRLSKTQAHELDAALLSIAEAERPTSMRGMYYMAMGEGEKALGGVRRGQAGVRLHRPQARARYGLRADGAAQVEQPVRRESLSVMQTLCGRSAATKRTAGGRPFPFLAPARSLVKVG